MKLAINVPDEQAAEIAGWEDGVEYELTVKQVGKGQFDLVSTESEASEEDEKTETKDEGPESMKEAADSFNDMKETED